MFHEFHLVATRNPCIVGTRSEHRVTFKQTNGSQFLTIQSDSSISALGTDHCWVDCHFLGSVT
jgi:hypothetical protein